MDTEKNKEDIRTQITGAAKKTELKSQLESHAKNIPTLADTNVCVVILGCAFFFFLRWY